MTLPNRPTPEGRALGAELVRLVEPEIAALVAQGEPDLRCASCAFRLGTVPNGSPDTVMDALKGVLEDAPFMCHAQFIPNGKGGRIRDLCHGWYAARVAMGETTLTAPWPYSWDGDAA